MSNQLEAKMKFEKGTVVMELALVVGLLALILMWCSEIVLIMGVREKLSIHGREGANVASRNCSGIPNPTVCLQNTRTDINNFGKLSVSNLDVGLSVFRYDLATNTVTSYQATGTNASHYVQANFELGPQLKVGLRNLLVANGTVVISEMFAPYQPIGINFGIGTLYEVTLF